MKRNFVYLLIFIAFLATLIIILNCSHNTSLSGVEYKNGMDGHYRVSPARIPDKAFFAGEKVPLEMYYVKESLDRELMVNMYWHTSTILLLKKANRWFPVITPILEKNNIPDDFKYLALIESGLSQVVSPSGAAGFWQFLPGTAKDYGLEVNDEVDERYHVIKSTEAACQYLNKSYEVFGNWTLVAASYNTGKSRIAEELRTQKVDNYYDLYLNEETSRYVFRIIAIKTIFNMPEEYGFFLEEDDLYQPLPTKEIPVEETIEDLRTFAADNNVSYRMLKEFNPWLRRPFLNNKDKNTYIISLPADGFIPRSRISGVRPDFFEPDTAYPYGPVKN